LLPLPVKTYADPVLLLFKAVISAISPNALRDVLTPKRLFAEESFPVIFAT
jgi:hypothetical protein